MYFIIFAQKLSPTYFQKKIQPNFFPDSLSENFSQQRKVRSRSFLDSVRQKKLQKTVISHRLCWIFSEKPKIFQNVKLALASNYAEPCRWYRFELVMFVIFRSICNIQEKLFIQYSVQWGQYSFFYLTKTANSFYSKMNDSSMVWTTAFSSSRFGVRVSVLCCSKYFYVLSLAFFDARN